MEADWEMELGSDMPVIDAYWPGFVDLRNSPERVNEVTETHLLPGLAEVLIRLNAYHSPVWTAKCDVWHIEDAIDPFELDAAPDEDTALACYIDLLPRSDQQWHLPSLAAAECREFTRHLHTVALRASRIDLVVRLAQIAVETHALGITAYATACGVDETAAWLQLSAVVAVLADTVTGTEDFARGKSPVQ